MAASSLQSDLCARTTHRQQKKIDLPNQLKTLDHAETIAEALKGAVEKVAFPRFCDNFREKIESLKIDICLSIGDLQTFDFFRKARERWGNGLFQQPLK